jgi:Spy/CpxP family protein refolding chaperone
MRVLTLLLLGGAALCAQPRSEFFAWWDSPVVKDLNLSEDQMKQIRAVTREYREKLIDLRGAVEKAEANVGDVMNEEQPDFKRGSEAINRLVAARGEMTRAVSEMGLKLRMVLNPEQWRELQRRRPAQPPPAPPRAPRPPRPGRPPQAPGPAPAPPPV